MNRGYSAQPRTIDSKDAFYVRTENISVYSNSKMKESLVMRRVSFTQLQTNKVCLVFTRCR
jgi:hypothetical protein